MYQPLSRIRISVMQLKPLVENSHNSQEEKRHRYPKQIPYIMT
jgi:hypothetical protein